MVKKFKQKLNTPIEYQLRDAILANKINMQYELPVFQGNYRQVLKSIKQYLMEYQFVEINYLRHKHFLAFDFPGPILFVDQEYTLINVCVVGGKWGWHSVLLSPRFVKESTNQELRISSGCKTGPIFGDETCDCNQQLRQSMQQMSKKSGLIIYSHEQDGRGWGDGFKNANQVLMNKFGLNTHKAAIEIYGERNIEQRDYFEQFLILKAIFGNVLIQKQFNFPTNNILKLKGLTIYTELNLKTKKLTTKYIPQKAIINVASKLDAWSIK